VTANTIDCFKTRLNKFWKSQDVKFDYKQILTGLHNRSVISAFFVTARAGTAYRKIWRLDNNFFARIIRLTVQKFQLFWVIFCTIFSLNYGTF